MFAWYKEVTSPQKKALFSAWLGYVFDGFDFMLIFYIMYLIKPDLGLTDLEGAFLSTAAFIGRPLGGAIFGLLADRFGRKPLMMWAIVAYSLGTGLSGIAVSGLTLALARFIVGMGMAGEGDGSVGARARRRCCEGQCAVIRNQRCREGALWAVATVTLRLAMRHGDHKKMRFMFQSRWTCAKALRGWGESDKRQELKAGWCGWRPVSEREREKVEEKEAGGEVRRGQAIRAE